jgi:hypothetical protein
LGGQSVLFWVQVWVFLQKVDFGLGFYFRDYPVIMILLKKKFEKYLAGKKKISTFAPALKENLPD